MKNSKLTNFAPNLMVDDVNKAVNYYEKVLDFHKIMSVPEKGQLDWAMVFRDNVTIMLQSKKSICEEYPKFENLSVGSTSNFYIEVTEIDAFYEKIKEKANIIKKPHTTFYGKKEFALEDCNGYLFTFAECQT